MITHYNEKDVIPFDVKEENNEAHWRVNVLEEYGDEPEEWVGPFVSSIAAFNDAMLSLR